MYEHRISFMEAEWLVLRNALELYRKQALRTAEVIPEQREDQEDIAIRCDCLIDRLDNAKKDKLVIVGIDGVDTYTVSESRLHAAMDLLSDRESRVKNGQTSERR